jgi:hypothetical protein
MELASSDFTELFKRFEPALLETGGFVLGKVASVGLELVSFVASVIIAGVLLGPAPRLAIGIRTFAERIAGDRGVGFVTLAGATIRNVARGVIGVALLQTLLAGVVFSVFTIPASSVLTLVVLILFIVKIGPALVLFSGHRLGVDGNRSCVSTYPDGVADPDRTDRQCDEAHSARPRSLEAHAGHPARGPGRHAVQRPDRPVSRAHRPQRVLRPSPGLAAVPPPSEKCQQFSTAGSNR